MTAQGTTFGGRYEVLHRLGSGGMAEVYLARDQLLGREVAIKVLNERYSTDRAFVERFRREAQSAASLNHPNIVSLFDYGSDNDTYFIVMEYIDGRSLAEIIAVEGPLLPERAAEVAVDVASALERAHNAGLVHRDVKPSNIMLTSLGQTKVTDFGIARALRNNSEATVTQAGVVMGTAAYLSPEQAQGHPVDPRSDVYALGVVLFEMLTGRPPFTGETPLAIAYKHVREHAPPPSQTNPHVPESLDAVTLKALSKNPANRYASAADMRDDLQRFLAGQKVHATPLLPSDTQSEAVGSRTQVLEEGSYSPPPPRRNRTGIYLASTLLILLLFGLIAWVLANNLLGGEDVTVPNLVGITESQARDRLEDLGLDAESKDRFSDKPPGEVVAQDPEQGEVLQEGDTVTLIVSSGQRQVTVPDVVGSTVEEAETVLEDEQLKLGEVQEVPNEEFEEGVIFDQSPDADDRVDIGSKIDVSVSTGPAPVIVPNVEGQPEDTAVEELEGVGLEAAIEGAESEDVPEGDVISQSPAAGSEVEPGSVVTLVISEGPPPQELPDVTGQNADEAEAALESEFGVDVTQEPTTVPCTEPPGAVCDQSPDPGSTVEPGDDVTLFVQPDPPVTPTASLLELVARFLA